MKREVMASVLLACMIFANPVYADDDRTPDEYNPDAKYESPLDQSMVQAGTVLSYTADRQELAVALEKDTSVGVISGRRK